MSQVPPPEVETEIAPPDPDPGERPRRPWWRRRVVLVPGSLLVAALCVLGILRSPLFAARDITVEGTGRLSEARVLRIAGIAEGQNLFTFDAGEARRRLEADPWVATAEVSRHLPDAITVRVTERVPVAAIESHLGWEVLAADGVVLATSADEPKLPTITAAVPGDDVATLGARVLGAMDTDLRSEVGTLTIGVDGIVRLVLRSGVSVSYGDAGETVEKAQALAAVLAWADEEHAHVQEIDVSVPGAPTARLAGGGVATP